MKIIEALKKVKANRVKISDLSALIGKYSAHMESGTTSLPYKDPAKSIAEWSQSIFSLSQDNAILLSRIQKTNLVVMVPIEIDGKIVTKNISEWVYRRREGVDQEMSGYASMGTRLTATATKDKDGNIVVDRVVYNYDQAMRDKKLSILKEEKSLIDSALEIVNATTDLVD